VVEGREMRHLISALIVFAAFGSWPNLVQAQNAKPWVEVSSSNEFFRVSMPQQPVGASQHTRLGNIDATGTRYEAFTDGAGYTLWTFVDANHRSLRGLDEYLDACADLVWDGLLNTTKGQLSDGKRAPAALAYVKELSLPLPGREYSLSMGSATGTVRFFVADARIYVLLAANSPDGPWERQKFFESFSVFIVPPSPQPRNDSAITANPSEATDYKRVFTGSEVTKKIQILSQDGPAYPQSARRYQLTGTVVLRALFSRDGRVTDIQVIKKLPHGLTGAAIKAARAISFAPAEKDGLPVSTYMELQYSFNLY
jgi:TonB family protein